MIGEGGTLSQTDFDRAIASLSSESPLRDSCLYITSTPGKQFRAALLLDAARYGSRPVDPLVIQAAVAVELFHAATLAHDDVVDDGQLRRGKPAVGAHSGNLAASLAGGWLFARSIELIADLGHEAAASFAETASVVCEGEMLETLDLFDTSRNRERYDAAIYAKTASLIEYAAWLGAKAGEASPGDVEGLKRYGKAVGMAFQIADDVLDLVADPKASGKSPGTDLRHGVYTLPVIYALELDESLREPLLRRPEEHELPGLVERIRATGGVAKALEDCRYWIEEAHAALPSVEPRPEHGQRLASLATTVVGRVEEMMVP
jgi:heptaprenyl diphosphate synthase